MRGEELVRRGEQKEVVEAVEVVERGEEMARGCEVAEGEEADMVLGEGEEVVLVGGEAVVLVGGKAVVLVGGEAVVLTVEEDMVVWMEEKSALVVVVAVVDVQSGVASRRKSCRAGQRAPRKKRRMGGAARVVNELYPSCRPATPERTEQDKMKMGLIRKRSDDAKAGSAVFPLGTTSRSVGRVARVGVCGRAEGS